MAILLGGTSVAISKNTPINFAKISEEMAVTTERWMNSTIEIVDPNLEDLQWDEFNNDYVSGTESVLWSGRARIQFLGVGTDPITLAGFSSPGKKMARVQVRIDPNREFIRKGLEIRVTDGGEDPDLIKLQFVVRNAINSSYAWLRTIECEVDTKSVIDDGS
jgi:hypothetical protein